MAKTIRITVDKQIWDDTPWIFVGPLLHGAFSYAAGKVRSPYLDAPSLHYFWDAGWTMAAKGKITTEITDEESKED
jgi:hypothetical protein